MIPSREEILKILDQTADDKILKNTKKTKKKKVKK